MADLDWVYARACTLVMEHLPFSDWVVTFNRARHEAGSCDFEKGTIFLSIPHMETRSEWEAEQIILHEIGHALAGEHHAHDKVWKKAARDIGYEGGVTVEGLPAPKTLAHQILGTFAALIIWAVWYLSPVWVVVFSVATALWIVYKIWTVAGPIPSKYLPHRADNSDSITPIT